ncbi:MAG: GTP cyclohydrolase I FolE [Minisyncoccia bacterium]|jgi:GTP cyclohydrolase I
MSFQKGKTDAELGYKVEEYLKSKGVHTPTLIDPLLKKEEWKIKKIEKYFTSIMETLGLDLQDDSLIDTPKRVAKMYVNEIFWGLKPDNFPKVTVIQNKMGYDEMVIEKDITLMSNCEHHFVTIDGKAHIAYIPKDKVLGLSKLNRIVEYFARRPQVQERIAEQVYHSLAFILGTEDIAVVIEGVHYCVKSRGVEDHSSYTYTAKLGGCFRTEPEARAEFMSLIKR